MINMSNVKKIFEEELEIVDIPNIKINCATTMMKEVNCFRYHTEKL